MKQLSLSLGSLIKHEAFLNEGDENVSQTKTDEHDIF